MYLVPVAWLYVTLMMAIAEATNSNGTVLGAIVTFVLYGLLPVTLVVYLMRTPGRRKAIRAREAAASAASSGDPDTGGHTTAATEGDVVAPVREKE
jgi:hypothetical protein